MEDNKVEQIIIRIENEKDEWKEDYEEMKQETQSGDEAETLFMVEEIEAV